MSQGKRQVLVYGGKGALGSSIVDHFRSKGFSVTSVDLFPNDSADKNIILSTQLPFLEQAEKVKKELSAGDLFDGIFCVAGGWAGGNWESPDLLKNAQLMVEQSLWSSLIATSLAPTHLKPKGLLILTGAQPALNPTPSMVAYGVAKAAVHQLVKSIGADESFKGSVQAILPVTLDTPMNRKFMTWNESWTPLEDVAKKLEEWLERPEARPKSGSLVQVVTKGGETSWIPS